MNQEFQEAKRRFSISQTPEEKDANIELMRAVLMKRNEGVENYEFSYIETGKRLSIMTCSVEELFAIDGDMTPRGL
jgi:hypothetical protein